MIKPGKEGITSVIAVVTLHRFAAELIWLFSPLYVLGIGRSLGFSIRNSFLVVIGYFLLLFLTKLLATPLAENSSFRIGYRRTLIISVIPFLFFIIFLSLSQNRPFLLVPVAIFWGIHTALFWFGYHGLFVKRADQKQFGKQTGIAQALYILVSVITPVLGGLIILKLGYQVLFLIAGAIFVFGVMVVFFSREIKPYHDARIIKVLQLFGTHKKVATAYLGWGLETAIYGVIWPVFLFLLVGKILSFSEIVSAAVLLTAIITYLVGLIVDRIGEKGVVDFGSVVNSLTWMARAIVKAPVLIVGVDGIYRVTEQMLAVPLSVLSYKKAIDGGTSQALYFREISLNVGAIISLIVVGVLIFLNLPLWTTFLLASLGSLVTRLATRG